MFRGARAVSFYMHPGRPLKAERRFSLIYVMAASACLPMSSFVCQMGKSFRRPVSFFPPRPNFCQVALCKRRRKVGDSFLGFGIKCHPRRVISPVSTRPSFSLF